MIRALRGVFKRPGGLTPCFIAAVLFPEVLPIEVRTVAVQVPPGVSSGSHPIVFQLQSINDAAIHLDEKAAVLVPR